MKKERPTPTGKRQLYLSRPVVTLSLNHSMLLNCEILEPDGTLDAIRSGAVWTNETPELLTIRGDTVYTKGISGTGYLTVSYEGQTQRLTIRIIPLADQINLRTMFITLPLDSSSSTQLYVFNTSKFYGQDYTVSWSVNDPSVLALEAVAGDTSCVRFTGKRTGDAYVVCRVSLPDGSTAEERCYVHVY